MWIRLYIFFASIHPFLLTKLKIYSKVHNGEFRLSFQLYSSFDFWSLFSLKAARRFLTKKLKAEGSTRESALGFALNFYDALTDKAAEILLAIRIWLVKPISFELHHFVINEMSTSFSLILWYIFNLCFNLFCRLNANYSSRVERKCFKFSCQII